MDLFGSAPNLKCSNEAVCYNAAASPQTPSNNREGSRLGFDCIVPSILLVDKLHHNSQSSSVLLDTECNSTQTHQWCEVFQQSLFLVMVTLVCSFCGSLHFSAHISQQEFINLRSATSPGGLSNLNRKMTEVNKPR